MTKNKAIERELNNIDLSDLQRGFVKNESLTNKYVNIVQSISNELLDLERVKQNQDFSKLADQVVGFENSRNSD